MMKKTLTIALAIFIAASMSVFGFACTAESVAETVETETTAAESTTDEEAISADTAAGSIDLRSELLGNAVLTVPETDEEVKLDGEKAEWSLGYVLIGDLVAGLPDGSLVGILEVNTGGNAEDVYLAAFQPGENAWQMTDAVLLGDYASNADVRELYTDDETIHITYYTYDEDIEAQAEEKTVENNETYTYLNGKLTFLSGDNEKESDVILPDLAGTSWEWEKTEMNDDSLYKPEAGDFIITFNDDGSFISTSDCNTINGFYGYNAATGQILFEDIIQTLKECPESLEDTYISNLQNSEQIFIENDTMYLQLKLDGGTMTFKRVSD